ncbi:MAG: hypothetical protein P1S60_15970 [Anaerolineae bacterium]|nr:hypothetical protein [Anaerolineae bacterium]
MWIPSDTYLRLLFGYWSLETLMDAWPDISVKEGQGHIWDREGIKIADIYPGEALSLREKNPWFKGQR